MRAVKMRLEEVAGQVGSVIGQVNSIQDSLKILLKLVVQITTLRKENGSSDVAEPSQTKHQTWDFEENLGHMRDI